MTRTSERSTAFGISIGFAFIGGYADAASFLLAHTFTGHLTGNCVLAAWGASFDIGRHSRILQPVPRHKTNTPAL